MHSTAPTAAHLRDLPEVEWFVSDLPVPYEAAVAAMERRVDSIIAGTARELVWLLEHPPLYTAGTSAKPEELLEPTRFPVHSVGRGGKYTYHGPGQRIAYVMLDARRRAGDVRAFVSALEAWVIAALRAFNVEGGTRPDRVGVWVPRPERGAGAEDKIAAIGIRLRRWVSFHGVSVNVEPDLEHFAGIVPCGVQGYGVTSLADLGRVVRMEEVDMALESAFEEHLGSIRKFSTLLELT
ncbi:MAG TPA: lipoyl(octanoyl) transferase LipB [Hyphomicrobiaceae bacterium]|nr:lipoyl(octanoyl) transferase LipB [Hyphomicrobiaceae bacterium]